MEYIENGRITLIASTTENPYFYVYNAILSRCTVFEFKSVESEEIKKAVFRAVNTLEKESEYPVDFPKEAADIISKSCGGDVRKAMNSVELCFASAELADGVLHIKAEDAAELSQKSAMKYDRDGDEHYDIVSAYQKSMRGSDPDAALHYLGRLLEAGDLISACRRLMVCAAEDVGLAYPQIIPIVNACTDMAMKLGLPEARIPLADAVVLVSTAPKSNTAYLGIDSAVADIRAGNIGPIPRQLQNMHYDGEDNQNKGQFYKYPHDYENRYVEQQYLPDVIKNRVYYKFGDNKNEQAFKQYWEKVKGKKLPG